MKKIIKRMIKDKIFIFAVASIMMPTFWVQYTGNIEPYPYYNWFMFRSVYPNKRYYSLEILSEDDVYKDVFVYRKRYLSTAQVGMYNRINNISIEFVKQKNKSKDEKLHKSLRKIIKKSYHNRKMRLVFYELDRTDYVKFQRKKKKILKEVNGL